MKAEIMKQPEDYGSNVTAVTGIPAHLQAG